MFALNVEEYQTKGGKSGVPGKGYDVALVKLSFAGQNPAEGTRITGWGPDKARDVADAIEAFLGENGKPLADRIRKGADKCTLLMAEKNASKRGLTAKILDTL